MEQKEDGTLGFRCRGACVVCDEMVMKSSAGADAPTGRSPEGEGISIPPVPVVRSRVALEHRRRFATMQSFDRVDHCVLSGCAGVIITHMREFSGRGAGFSLPARLPEDRARSKTTIAFHQRQAIRVVAS